MVPANFEVTKNAAGGDATRRKSMLPGQKTDEQKAQVAAVSTEKLGANFEAASEP